MKLWSCSSSASVCMKHWRMEMQYFLTTLYGFYRWVVAKEVEQAQAEAQKRFPGKNVTLSQVGIV